MPRSAIEVIVVCLLLLWLLGAFAYPVGTNLILLLVPAALVVIVVRTLQVRRVLD